MDGPQRPDAIEVGCMQCKGRLVQYCGAALIFMVFRCGGSSLMVVLGRDWEIMGSWAGTKRRGNHRLTPEWES